MVPLLAVRTPRAGGRVVVSAVRRPGLDALAVAPLAVVAAAPGGVGVFATAVVDAVRARARRVVAAVHLFLLIC